MLAMHMDNYLLDGFTAAATLTLAAVAVAVSAGLARRHLDAERLPLMGVMGAFVFAAQMINFTLPGMPGTSGHLGGGVLLAITLGPWAGIVTMASILIVQCLLFQDGGLLALGCNIINMGVLPCLVGWGCYRLILGPAQQARAWRQYLAAWLACVLAVTGGAALVPIETAVAGRLNIPTSHFLAVMVGVHVVIGFIEGLITFVVIAYLRQVRPAAVGLELPDAPSRLGRGWVVGSLVATAMLLSGAGVWFASRSPDGLEWCTLHHRYNQSDQAVKPAEPVMAEVSDAQARLTPLPDYGPRAAPIGQVPAEPADEAAAQKCAPAANGWASLAGLIGTVVTLGLVFALSRLLRRGRAKNGNNDLSPAVEQARP